MASLVTCRVCQESFASDGKRKAHVRQMHQAQVKCITYDASTISVVHIVERMDGVFKCPLCPRTFKTPKGVRQHSTSCRQRFKGDEVGVKLYTPAETILEIGLEYNKNIGLIVCAICRFGLTSRPKEVAKHFKRVHKTTISVTLLQKKFESLEFSTIESLGKYLQPTAQLLESVNGIELRSGFSCGQCVYFAPHKDTMAKHLRASHQDVVRRSFVPCMVQSIFGGKQKKFFGVRFTDGSTSSGIGAELNAPAISDAVCSLINDYVQNDVPVAPTDERLISPFLRRMKWHEVIEKHCTDDVAQIIASVSFDRDVHLIKLLHPVVCRYWDISQTYIGEEEYLIERLFSSPGDEIVSSSSLRRIQTRGDDYCKSLTSLLFMVDTHANQPIVNTHNFQSDVVVRKLKALVTSCENMLALATSDSICVDDIGVSQLKYLDELLEAVFCINLDNMDSPSLFHAFPTHRFVVCSSILGPTRDASGYAQFKKPGQVTSLVAKLKCWARLAALMNFYQRAWGVECTEDNLMTRTRANTRGFYLKVGHRTPFNMLQEVMSFGSSIAMAPEQRRLPQIAWLKPYTELLVEGHRISLKTLIEIKTQLVTRFSAQMRENVLLGFNVSSIQEMMESDRQYFYDDFSNYTCGYSFLEDERNPWKSMRMDLVKYLLHDRRSKFVASVRNGKITFQLAAVSEWCSQVDRVTKLLAPMLYILSGQPSRAAELSATTIRNSVSGERSIYMLQREVLIVQRYHKGLSISGQHRLIARFLPKELSLDFVVYLALVRPAKSFFAKHFQRGEHASASARSKDASFYNLFCTFDMKQMDGKSCRSAINSFFLRCNTQLSIKTYRHVAIAFMEKHLKSTRSDQEMFDFQAAHAPITASTLYSRSTGDPYFMSRDEMAEFQSCSRQWHRLLELEIVETNTSQTSAAPRNECTEVVNEPTAFNNASELHRQPHTRVYDAVLPHRLATFTMPTFPQPNLTDALNCLLPQHFAAARILVRQFLRNPDADFRSTEQCTAATLILRSVTNLLVVLATNGGKSLLYQLAAFSDQSRVVIVVIPLVALLMDSIRKTEALGLDCCAYSPNMSPHAALPSVLFVGVDYLAQEQFHTFLSSISAQNLINRIFFDEAHLALTAQDYRNCMSSVYRLASIPVQKTLLTATLPPNWEHDLATSFGFPLVTIRTKTLRPSIGYSVKHVATHSKMLSECLSIFNVRMTHPSKGIIFALTKPKVEEIAAFLIRRTGKIVSRYHSGMSSNEKKESLATWKSADCSFIVATCGLGQGVDYPQVRTVIHFGLAHSLTDYAQETGRSGRDGKTAKCVTIYCDSYYQKFAKNLSKMSPTKLSEIRVLQELRSYIVDSKRCRRQRLQEAMDGLSFPCTLDHKNALCDVCIAATTDDANFSLLTSASREIQEQSTAAKEVFANDELVYWALHGRLFGDKRTHCSVCWVSSPFQFQYHSPIECQHLLRRCLKCLDEQHLAQACQNQLMFGNRPSSCYFCGVPLGNILGKGDLHYGSLPGSGCNTNLRHRMIPGVWKFYGDCQTGNNQNGDLERQISLFSRSEFSTWLVLVPPGRSFTNLCILWAYILKLYSC